MLQQQDCKDKNPQSTQNFQLDEIPNDTLQILQDSQSSFSKNPAYIIKNGKAKEVEPEKFIRAKP